MFSFINFIQSVISTIKKRKGLWFSILTISSIIGVLVSITLMNIMTNNVAKKTYLEVHRVDVTLLQNTLDEKYDSLLSIAGVTAINPDIIANIKSESDKSVNDLLSKAKETINDRVNIDPINITYYAKAYKSTKSENAKYADLVMNTQTSITGIVVNKSGTRIIGITPVIDKNITIGAIEVSQRISSVKNSFDKLGKEFVFLMNKSQLVFISLEAKQGMTQDIGDKYKIFFHNYNPQFFTNIRRINLDELQRNKYTTDKNYYTTYDEVVDINGKVIGLFVIGEEAGEANSFVNITKNLIGSVTTVALGLVISLILFMF